MLVQTANVGIGGFIITGTGQKQVLVRAIGPSLAQFGVPNALADPILELHGPPGFVTIINDNWRELQPGCEGTGLVPTNDLESCIDVTLDPGAYTAIVKGKNNSTGVGLVEVYDLGPPTSQLGNISTRAFVGRGDQVLIGGFILGPGVNSNTAIRGLGPSLWCEICSNLYDPTLELRDNNGVLLVANDNWQDDPAMAAQLIANGLALPYPSEPGIFISLQPGLYTAILAGKNGGTGMGLLEIYNLQ